MDAGVVDVVVDVGTMGAKVVRVRFGKLNGRGLDTMPRNGLCVDSVVISFSVVTSTLDTDPIVDVGSVFGLSWFEWSTEEERVDIGVWLLSEVVVVVVVMVAVSLGAVNSVSRNGGVSFRLSAFTAPPKCTFGVGVTSSALSSDWSFVTVLVA